MRIRTRTRFGPTVEEDGTRFRLYAPGASRAELLLEDGVAGPASRRIEMVSVGEGFFEAFAPGVGPGARYRFSRDGEPPLPDPASRFQPDGVFGASEVILHDRAWRDDGWTGRLPEERVIYELHVGAFTEEGTWAGLASKLDHLARLGVTTLEIMPVAAFPGRRNWGYDGVFSFAPFAGYGRPEELAAFVDECHGRGLAVILDFVTNHFGPEGNALWGLAPAFFRPDRPTAWSSGLAWESEAVLAFFDEAAVHWLRDFHLDGLRLDAFHAVPDEHRAVHLRSLVLAIDEALPPERRVLLLLESRDNQTSLLDLARGRVEVTQLNFDHQRAFHALLTGERHGEYGEFVPPEVEVERCLASGFAFMGRYSHTHRRVLGEARGPERWDQLVAYLENHDTCGNRCLGERLDLLVDEDRLRAATALLLLHPATPMLFMGEEWSAHTPFHFFTDLEEELGRAVDEGRRRLFREVTDPALLRRSPLCQDLSAFARSHLRFDDLDQPDHRAFHGFVRSLLALRREVRPLMSARIADTRVLRHGRVFQVRVGPVTMGGPAHLLVSNFEDEALVLASPGDLLFTSRRPADGQVPSCSTELYRVRGQGPRSDAKVTSAEP